jgi:hypothetical protein
LPKLKTTYTVVAGVKSLPIFVKNLPIVLCSPFCVRHAFCHLLRDVENVVVNLQMANKRHAVVDVVLDYQAAPTDVALDNVLVRRNRWWHVWMLPIAVIRFYWFDFYKRERLFPLVKPGS